MADAIPVYYYNTGSGDTFKPYSKWWEVADGEIHQHVTAVVRAIQQNQSYRKLDNLRYARLYANTDLNHYVAGAVSQYFGRKISLNVVRSCCNTAAAKIAKSKPRPMFLTEDGDYSQQRRAKKLTQYIDGLFYRESVYWKGKRTFLDAGIFGTGVMKVFRLDDKVAFERVFIDEILVDDVDGRDGYPRQMHQTKLMHREVLQAMFPDMSTKIESCAPYNEINKGVKASADVIEVVESWHLPSGPEAGDGKHVIAIDNATLQSVEYKKMYFPFVVMQWDLPVLGWYGEGIAAQLVGIQLEINLIMQRIKEAQELIAVPRIFVEEGSGVNTSHLTDEVGAIVKFRGQAPTFMTPTAMNREMYDYLEYLYRKSFEDTGISQLSATSKKPAGLESAVALREYNDIETERFALVAERYQQFYLDAGKIAIDLQREIEEDSPGQSVNVSARGFIKTIKWKDVDMEDDAFVMQPYPTNFLPKTPEGKIAFTQELIQGGYLEDPREALSLLDFPDLEGFFNLRTAAIDDIKWLIEKMIDEGEYVPPEPYSDLNLGVKMVQSAYLRAKSGGVDESRLELMRRYIDEAQALLLPPPTQVAGQAIPSAPPEAGAPPVAGMPATPPVSPLMPMQG